MAERSRTDLRDETGTTLVELLVVMVIMAIVGTITTVGIVQGFRAQMDATEVAETLDGTRLATQRVRDFVRGADEVCPSSGIDKLVLWTDDDNNGEMTNEELDIFELALFDGREVFQRRVPLAGGEEIQLIRDDIINDALFSYNGDLPTEQPDDLACTDGPTPSGTGDRTRTVSVEFTVQNPADSADPELTTSTTVRIRNAGLQSPEENEPIANTEVTCSVVAAGAQCVLDGSGSEDRSNAGTGLTYNWRVTNQATGLESTFTGEVVTFTSGVEGDPYEAVLTVLDGVGKSDQADPVEFEFPVVGGNPPPTAVIDFSCTATACTFDGSNSTDDKAGLTYSWTFGDGNSATGAVVTHTYAESRTARPVTLSVADSGDDSGNNVRTDEAGVDVIASEHTVRVESIRAVGSGLNGANKWSATITVTLSRTNGGALESGITISGSLSGDVVGSESCATRNTTPASCSISINNLRAGKSLTFELSQVSPQTGSSLVYDENQNEASSITVTAGTTVQEPSP